MKIIDKADRKVGDYYAIYRKTNGTFKGFSVYKYESIFGEITERFVNSYNYGCTMYTGTKGACFEHTEVIHYEINDMEQFKHVEMELITQNL